MHWRGGRALNLQPHKNGCALVLADWACKVPAAYEVLGLPSLNLSMLAQQQMPRRNEQLLPYYAALCWVHVCTQGL